MANTWFVILDGREQGPLTPAQLKALVSAGRIAPDTPIRRDDLAKPVRAGSVKGLLPPPASGFTVVPADPPGGAPVAAPDAQPPASAPAGSADEDAADPLNLRATPMQRVIAVLIDGAVMTILVAALVIGAMVAFASAEVARAAASQEQWNAVVAKLDAKTINAPSFAGFRAWAQERRPVLETAARTAQDGIRSLEAPDGATGAEAIALRKYELGNALIAAENGLKDLDWLGKQHARIDQDSDGAMALGAIVGISLLGLLVLVSCFGAPAAEAWWGTTLGKRMLGLRVLRLGGGRIGLGRALLRHLLRGIPFGQLRAFLVDDRLALHDSLSGTEVTRREPPTGGARRSVARRPARTSRVSRQR